MKKFVSLLLAVLMTAALFTGCAKQPQAPDQPQEEAVTIRVGGLKGPTSMGLVKLLDDAENQKTANAIDFRMAASANELTPLLLQGELDILAVPANLGSVLYNKTEGQVKMLAVSTLGVLYMVEKGGETVTDIKSLAGKTIYATGKGATPEYALTYLLARNGLELGKDVNVEWKSEPTEIVAQMAAMDNAVAMLPQPFVVVADGPGGGPAGGPGPDGAVERPGRRQPADYRRAAGAQRVPGPAPPGGGPVHGGVRRLRRLCQ